MLSQKELLMKSMHFMGAGFNTRGRITVKGIERCSPFCILDGG